MRREAEYRVRQELRVGDEDTGRVRPLRGYAALWNDVADFGDFRERFLPGAFRKAIAKDDIRALVNHDPDRVLGRARSRTLTLREDSRGLAVTIVPPDIQLTRDLVVSIQRGDVDAMSVAFEVDDKGQRWHRDADGRWMREIVEVKRLWDVSVCTFAAYQHTEVAVRALGAMMTPERALRAERVRGERNDLAVRLAEAHRRLRVLNMQL